MKDRRLRPGGALPKARVAESQRARVYGAIVASCAERGYHGTRLEDLEEISGVSGRSFYELFPDKAAAFVEALKILLQTTVDQVLFDPTPGDWETGVSDRLHALSELLDQQGPAAKMCLVEAYAAGPQAVDLLEQATRHAERLIRERLAESPERAAMPPEMAVAAVGAVLEVMRSNLMRGATIPIPALLTFLLSYRPPSRPVRSAARAPEIRPETVEASDHAERALRAFEELLTEMRYAEVTMEQVAARARMSRRTLYANFADRERLLSAAIDSACAQALAVTVPAYHRHEVPAEGLRAAIEALLAFLASRPNLAHLLLISSNEGGEPALRRRHQGLRPLRSVLRDLPSAPPGAALSGLAIEASVGGLLGLMRRRLLDDGSGALVGLGPICTYMVLAPLIGVEQATTAAEGRAYRRVRPDLYAAMVGVQADAKSARLLLTFSQGAARTAAEAAADAGIPLAESESMIANLVENGLLHALGTTDDGKERLYRSHWPLIETAKWATIEQGNREAASAEIGRVIEAEVEEAFAAGTFDSRPERHLARIPMRLDEQGWQELHDQLVLTVEACLDIGARAGVRLTAAEDPDGGIPARVYIVSFEAPGRGGVDGSH
ncbi:MAG TPA: TetR/AcrR family transcriptional regulator [Solirubrobacterales bacterium]|nr:TetR/AcrR family transcriptional regulator [Solirubrobacterales bacterium]